MPTRRCLAAAALVSLALAACDHTRLTGRIVPEREVVRVGESLRLDLEVPPELSNIHRVLWELEPADAGEIRWTRAETGTADRAAVVVPSRAGEFEVRALGYYKQTNPQPITSIRLRVAE